MFLLKTLDINKNNVYNNLCKLIKLDIKNKEE